MNRSIARACTPLFWAALLALLCSCLPARVLAQLNKWNLRQSVAVGIMISNDQMAKLSYDEVAVLGSLYGGRTLWPWLELRGGVVAGRFFSSEESSGGLLSLTAGALLRVERAKLSPYVAFDVGPARTDELYRPYFSFTAGLDARLTDRVAIGPTLGVGQLVQWNAAANTSDARFLWFGLTLRERLGQIPKPVVPPPRVVITRYEHVETVRHEQEPPSTDVLELLERALPSVKSARVEMLAPVLFDLDADRLEATGIAMLHEVRRTLEAHPELERVEIEGYADQQGDAGYNVALSARRAERVRSWLVAHGIARERLVVSAHGESELVESGVDAAAHKQNRRVIFRVVQQKETP